MGWSRFKSDTEVRPVRRKERGLESGSVSGYLRIRDKTIPFRLTHGIDTHLIHRHHISLIPDKIVDSCIRYVLDI